MEQIDVLIVDDSALVRQLLTEILKEQPLINRIDTAINGYFALKRLEKRSYDVILLDIEMPQMNGLEFLEEYNKRGYDIPVIIVSSYTKKGSEITIKALQLNAKDFIEKPGGPITNELEKIKTELIQKILFWGLKHKQKSIETTKKYLSEEILEEIQPETIEFTNPTIDELLKEKLIYPKALLIGASTGGPKALKTVLSGLSHNFPLPIFIVQHMPPNFTREFAENLNSSIPHLEIKEAEGMEKPRAGLVLIAPGGKHLKLEGNVNEFFAVVDTETPPVNGHKPSVDVLFSSASEVLKKHAIAVILTGMGKDGAMGMKKLREKGAITIAQSERTCVVFGMPKQAIKLGAVDLVLDLEEIPKYINLILEKLSY